MSNLVIGAIKNYNFKDIEPFVMSLINSGYKGEIVLTYNNIDEETIKKLIEVGVTPVPFDNKFPYMSGKYLNNMGIVPNSFPRELHVFSMRYIPYYLYLLNCGKQYDNIMVTDVRDVIFQKDPFDFPINNKICSFLEAEGWLLKDSDFNGNEIRLAYGKEALDKIGENLISCCGVTIGPGQAMLKYLEKMIELILAGDGTILLDQGTHNYIVYNNLVPGAEIKFYKNHEGPVMTLGYEKKVYKNKDGLITDKHGRVVNIFHQYDRHFGLAWKYYDWTARKKFIIWWSKGLLKSCNDKIAKRIKTISPRLHLVIKKIKTSLVNGK